MNESQRPMGAGLLPFHRGLAVFGVKRLQAEGGQVWVRLTGIGGKVEPGETFLKCAIRECVEETGTAPAIAESPKTWIMREPDVREAAPSEDGALLIVHKQTPGFPQAIEIRVFVARLEAAPKPVEKLRHLLFIPVQLLREIAEGRVTLSSFRARGGKIVSAEGEQPLQEGIVTFIDSPEVYARHLDSAIIETINNIVRGDAHESVT